MHPHLSQNPRENWLLTAAEWLDLFKKSAGVFADQSGAEALGVSPSRFSRWRTSKEPIPLDVGWKICLAAQVDPLSFVASREYFLAPIADRHVWLDLYRASACTETPQEVATDTPATPLPAEVHTSGNHHALDDAAWSDAEDATLVELYITLTPISEISTRLGRPAKLILFRLQDKHKLMSHRRSAAILLSLNEAIK